RQASQGSPESERSERRVEVRASAVARGRMHLGQPRPRPEERLAQGQRLGRALVEPATAAQLRYDKLREVAGRVEGVVLPQVDTVDAVVVEPALDLVGHDGGRSRYEVAILALAAQRLEHHADSRRGVEVRHRG